jgi:uncharacterized tellurite resistance protein B-like protein
MTEHPPTVTLALAKVIIAAAWADGRLSNDEINSLKDLLFRLPKVAAERELHLSGRDWQLLELYMDSPVGPEERARLLDELKAALRGPADRDLALAALDDLAAADGIVTDEERAVVAEIKAALQNVDLNIFAQLGRWLRGPIERRGEALVDAPNREHQFDDFVRNKIYYTLRRRFQTEGVQFEVPDAELRKLSLAGGLMARVAHSDENTTEDEWATITGALRAGWGLDANAAALVAEVALQEVSASLDFFRLVREFADATSEEERVRFVDVLFAVAAADGQVAYAENEEIRRIALNINLTKSQFADAKERFGKKTQG